MTDDEPAALKAELKAEVLAELKAEQPKPMERDVARYNDERRAWSEARASQIPPWLHAACAGGVRDEDARDLHQPGRPTGPSTQMPEDFGKVRTRPARPPGGGTGWLEPTPLSPPPGVNYADRLMDAQDAKDRAERMREEARRRDYEEQIDREAKLRLAMKNRE